jgi:hypothetical protein
LRIAVVFGGSLVDFFLQFARKINFHGVLKIWTHRPTVK